MSNANGTIAAASLLLALLPGASSGQTEPNPPAAAAPAPPVVEITPRQGLPGRDVALLVSGQPGGPIAVSGLVFPVASASNPHRIPWVLDIPGPTLVALAEGGAIDVELAVYAQRKDGEIVGHQAVTIHVAALPAAWKADGGLKLLGYVEVSKPATVLRVLVREPSSGAFGNWELAVPARAGETARFVDFGAGPTETGAEEDSGSAEHRDSFFQGMTGRSAVEALVAPEPVGAWVVAGIGGAGTEATAAPFSLVGAGSLPATRLVVRPGAVLKLTLLGEKLPAKVNAVARVVRGDGRPDVSCAARITSRMPAPEGPFEKIAVIVTLPANMPAGQHALVVTCRSAYDMAGGAAVGSASASLWVPGPRMASGALAWPAVASDEKVETAAAAGPSVGTRPSEEEAPPELKAAYRQALARYAADGSPESLRALVDFERSALGGGSSADLGRLASAERSVARAIAKGSPQAALGLCLVHLDLYREHSRDAAYLAIGHSRRMVELLAELLASDAKNPEGRSAAADILTVFGATLQSVGSYPTAERLFVRATALDGNDLAALMGRAGILERMGDVPDTIAVLKRVLSLRPDHVEANLRLGVNLRRARRDAEARKFLLASAAVDRPAWVRSVAWQEVASMLLADEKVSEAARVLREATAALPGDPHLQVLLACTLDRLRQHREAVAVVGSVVEHPAGETSSPRLVYAQAPHDDLDATRRALDAARAQTLAALAAGAQEEPR